MCTAGVDCFFCETIETCIRVKLAFPTAAEIEAETPGNIRARKSRSGRKGKLSFYGRAKPKKLNKKLSVPVKINPQISTDGQGVA